MNITVHDDYSVTGNIGTAELYDGELEVDSWNDGYSVEARLKGVVHSFKKMKNKDCVILLLDPPDEGKTVGNIHPKTNLIFDFRMDVGGVELRMKP